MGACVSAPSGDQILPNPGSDGPWKIAIVPVSMSGTRDCYIKKDITSGPKWLYLRREATETSSVASYFLESFVPDVGRFPDAAKWKRGNGQVLCAAKANELGPSCFTMEEWPLTLPPAPGQYPDGEYTSDDNDMRQWVAKSPTIVIQRAKWTLKTEAYIYEDGDMTRQAGTLHMAAFGKQCRHLVYKFGSPDSDHRSRGSLHVCYFRKISGIKYWYTPANKPDAMIPIAYRGRMRQCLQQSITPTGKKLVPYGSAKVDKVPASLSYSGPVFNANVATDVGKPKVIDGLASGIPPAVGMMIAYLATTALAPEWVIRYMPMFRFPAINVPMHGMYDMEKVTVPRADPPTPVKP